MKTALSPDRISLFVKEILENYNQMKSSAHSDDHHKKTNPFFDAIASCYERHRGALGKMTLKEFDKVLIPECHKKQPPGKKKLEEIAEREQREAKESAIHFMQVNCENVRPHEEEQTFLEDIMGSVGANLIRKFA